MKNISASLAFVDVIIELIDYGRPDLALVPIVLREEREMLSNKIGWLVFFKGDTDPFAHVNYEREVIIYERYIPCKRGE